MSASIVVPDFMPDVRYWLRTQVVLQPLHNGRVFFRIPDDGKIGGFPILRITRIGGGIVGNGGDTTLSEVDISIEAVHNQDSGYTALRQLTTALESVLFTMPAGTKLNPSGQTIALDARVTNVLDLPFPDTGWPRRVCDSRWVIQGL